MALNLRAMNMVYEGLKQKGSMIIVPSTAVETMGLGAWGGLTAFGQPQRAAPSDDTDPADCALTLADGWWVNDPPYCGSGIAD